MEKTTNREIIKVTEFEVGPLCCQYYWEDVEEETYNEYFDENGNSIKHHFLDDFIHINNIVLDYDLEKSYEKVQTVVQRKRDSKYFSISWIKGYYNNYPSIMLEVFPKQITTTIYE